MNHETTIIESPIMPACPAEYWSSLIFGENADDTLPHSAILSRAPGDIAVVRITHLALGEVIAKHDPMEVVFHVALFPQWVDKNEPHAELWIGREWRESNARLARLKELSQFNRETTGKRDEIVAVTMSGLEARFGIGSARAKLMSHEIAEAILAKRDITDVLTMLKLEALLEQFK